MLTCDAPRGRSGYDDGEIARWVVRFQETRDEHLRERIVAELRPLVVSTARRFRGESPEDLEAEAYVALVRAIDRFSPAAGARFSTFATHLMVGAIRHHLRDRGHLIRRPAWLQELDRRVRQVSADLEQRLGRPPEVAEIAEAANLTEEGVEELLSAKSRTQVCRLEPGAGEDDLLQVDPEKFRSRDYVSFELPIEDRVVLERAMCRLKALEQKVLRLFFFQERNQTEIAKTLGISCNYTGYVLRRGLKHMREGLEPCAAFAMGGVTDGTLRDGLTGLYLPSYFEPRVSQEVDRARATDQVVSVACLELQPACSDARFQEAARAIREHTRRLDVTARTGEREVSVLFPNTGRVVTEVAEKLGRLAEDAGGARVRAATATYPYAGRTGGDLLRSLRSGLAIPA